MEAIGINVGLLAVELLVFLLIGAFSIYTLLALLKQGLTGLQLAPWALIIIFIPIFGALTFWVVRPSARTQ